MKLRRALAYLGWLIAAFAVCLTTWTQWDVYIKHEILFLVPFQFVALAALFYFNFLVETVEDRITEEQRKCKHEWNPEHDGLDYAACMKCDVMIHRKDGDLLNPNDFNEKETTLK